MIGRRRWTLACPLVGYARRSGWSPSSTRCFWRCSSRSTPSRSPTARPGGRPSSRIAIGRRPTCSCPPTTSGDCPVDARGRRSEAPRGARRPRGQAVLGSRRGRSRWRSVARRGATYRVVAASRVARRSRCSSRACSSRGRGRSRASCSTCSARRSSISASASTRSCRSTCRARRTATTSRASSPRRGRTSGTVRVTSAPIEIATLLAVPQGPQRFKPRPNNAALRARRDAIVQKLIEAEVFTGPDAIAALAELAGPPPDHLHPMPREARHAAIELRAKYPKRDHIRSTLERGAQALVEREIAPPHARATSQADLRRLGRRRRSRDARGRRARR